MLALSFIDTGCATPTPVTQPKADSMSTVQISFTDLSHIKNSSDQFEFFFDSIRLMFSSDSSFSANSSNISVPVGKHTMRINKLNDTVAKSWEVNTSADTFSLLLKYFKPPTDSAYTILLRNKRSIGPTDSAHVSEFDLTRPMFDMSFYKKSSIIIR